MNGEATRPCAEAMLTIRPQFAAFMAGIAAFQRAWRAPTASDATVLIGAGLAIAGLVFIGMAAWSALRAKAPTKKHEQQKQSR